MELVERVKNWFKGNPSVDAKDMAEFRQGKINLVKGEISDIIDEIDTNDSSYLAMSKSTDQEIEKGMKDGDSLKVHFKTRHEKRNSELMKSLAEKNGDLRRHESKLEEIIKDDLEKGKKASHYSDCIYKGRGNSILMLLRGHDGDIEPNKWGLPGGHIDPGEDAETAAVREFKEETGLDAESANKTAYRKLKDGGSICFFNVYTKDYKGIISLDQEEHQNYSFFSVNDIKARPASDFIFDLKDVLLEILDPKYKHYQIIKKAHSNGDIDDETFGKAMSNIDIFGYES